MNNIFLHSGDLGDIIYACMSIKHLGGGTLYLTPGEGTREPMTQERADLIIPLLEHQSYIAAAKFISAESLSEERDRLEKHNAVYDFTAFRKRWNPTCSLAQIMAEEIGINWEDVKKEPWLDGFEDIPVQENGVKCVNRTGRYNNIHSFAGLCNLWHSNIVPFFIGTPEEYLNFEIGFRSGSRHIPTKNLLEAARVIWRCQNFYGNQSACYAIAKGMGIHCELEVCAEFPDTDVGF